MSGYLLPGECSKSPPHIFIWVSHLARWCLYISQRGRCKHNIIGQCVSIHMGLENITMRVVHFVVYLSFAKWGGRGAIFVIAVFQFDVYLCFIVWGERGVILLLCAFCLILCTQCYYYFVAYAKKARKLEFFFVIIEEASIMSQDIHNTKVLGVGDVYINDFSFSFLEYLIAGVLYC